jgi:hypothetical protein
VAIIFLSIAREFYLPGDTKVAIYQCLGAFNGVSKLHMIMNDDRTVMRREVAAACFNVPSHLRAKYKLTVEDIKYDIRSLDTESKLGT